MATKLDWAVFVLVLACTTLLTSCTTVSPGSQGGLNDGGIAAIILGILLLLLVVGTFVICFLYYKGYIGRREEQVIPFFPDINTTPESLRICTDAAFDRGTKGKYARAQLVSEPIIYIKDDIYHAPKSRPLPTYDECKEPVCPDSFRRRSRKHSRKRRHRKSHSLPRSAREQNHSKSRGLPRWKSAELTPTITSYPDDAVFISDKGGMKFTMYYETRSPYRDISDFSKTV